MQFCRAEDDEEDTQCCFFNASQRRTQQSFKNSKEGCCGLINSRIHQKNVQPPKQTRIICKSHRHQKSNQKGKLSLSKLSARKANGSQDNFQIKQCTSNVGGSHASAPKSRVNENNQINYTLQSKFLNNYQPTFNLNIPAANHLNIPHQLNNQHRIYHNEPLIGQVATYPIHSHRVGENFIPYNNFPPSYPQKNFIQQKQHLKYLSASVNPNNLRVLTRRSYKQQNISEDQVMVSSKRTEKQSNYNKVQPLKIGINTNAPTLQSSRPIVYTQMNETQIVPSQAGSPTRKTDQSYLRQQSEYGQSRFTQVLMPGLGREHLKTVQSIYGSEMGNKKEVQQSIILIDFFNPTEQLKRQIQQKINKKPFNDFRP